MSVIQSYRLPSDNPITQSQNNQEQDMSNLDISVDKLLLKKMLKQLSQPELLELLADVDIDLLKSETIALENRLRLKFEQEFDKKMTSSISRVKEEVKLEEATRNEKLKGIIDQFEAPEISQEMDIDKQAFLIACQITEKILNLKLTNDECYLQWAKQLITSTYGHHFPILNLNQQDYNQLEQYDLLDMLKDKVSTLIIKDIPRFSFQLNSDNGVSGHDSLAVIKKIESLLTENKGKQDVFEKSN